MQNMQNIAEHLLHPQNSVDAGDAEDAEHAEDISTGHGEDVFNTQIERNKSMGIARSFKRQMKVPGYVDRVLAMVKTGKIKPGIDQIVNIYHEDHCVWWTGSKRCNCHPDIRIDKTSSKGGEK